MSAENKPLQNFNVATMSGVYPGSRTMTYQRLRLAHPSTTERAWYQLHWTTQPFAATLLPVTASPQARDVIFNLAEPHSSDFAPRVFSALAQRGYQADACFACRHWQPQSHITEDGLPVGRCTWQDNHSELPIALALQSALSLACAHIERADTPPPPQPQDNQPKQLPLRVPKSAELDPDRLPFWPRLWHRLRRQSARTPRVEAWADAIIERSGVGAGTEPCFVCQGRLANLGALAVASEEDDKQTLSVWRCRRCYTLFMNDWTDRWERLENLETEERYYRIAPAEALNALQIIHSTVGGDHPARRQDRAQERAAMLALVADKAPLSHQIRQGR